MANAVKGSRQIRMVVVPYRPWLPVALAVSFATGVFLAALAGLYWGYYGASREHIDVGEENVLLSEALIQAQEQISGLRSELAMTGRDNLVDQRATEEVQSTINGLRERIMQLEQDVSFYRQVMSPDSAQLGLIIAELLVMPGGTSGSYRYRAVFTLAGAGDSTVEGSVEIVLVGQEANERKIYGMADLIRAPDVFEDALQFKYFQTHEAEFELPPGFVPEQIEVRAETSRPLEYRAEKVSSWSVEEV
jgi:hypothetical protein